MGNHRGGVGHSDRGGNNRGGVDGVGNNRGNRNSLRVLGLASVRDLSDVAINVVGVVSDGLDTAVRKVHLVGALNNTGAIVALSLAKGGLGVVVGNSVVVSVGGDLGKVIKRGSVCNSVDNRGSMGNSVVGNGVGDSGGGMDKRGSVGYSGVGNGVGNTMADQDLGSSRGSSEDCSKANEGLH